MVWCKNKMGQSQKYLSNLKNKTMLHCVLLVLSRGKSSIHSLYQSNHHLQSTLTLMHTGNTALNYTDIAGGGEVYFSYIKTDIKQCCGDLEELS